MREWKNAIVHALAAILALAPAAAFPDNPFAWLLAGFCYGWVREITEEQLKHGTNLGEAMVDALESWRDLLGWSIGGLVIGIAVALR